MPDISIDLQETPTSGRYVARVAGIAGEAELTYTKQSDALISADHTLAPDAMRGTGVAMALVERLIADARMKKIKIIPRCPYIAAQLKRHPEWSDVMSLG